MALPNLACGALELQTVPLVRQGPPDTPIQHPKFAVQIFQMQPLVHTGCPVAAAGTRQPFQFQPRRHAAAPWAARQPAVPVY